MSAGANRWLQWLALLAIVGGFFNFIWVLAESSTVGDASDGYVRDGRYYLVRGTVATEVSRERWAWAQVHPATLLVTHPLAMAGGAFLLFTVLLPAMLWTGDPVTRLERVERIRASGAAIASTRTGGRIGELSATAPLVGVDVHPGGAIIAVIGMPAFGIETSAMTSVAPDRYLGTSVVRIIHRQRDTPADIRLYLTASSPVAQALMGLTLERVADGPPRGPAADRPALEPESVRSIDSSPEPYPTVMKVLILCGLALNVVFLIVAAPFGRQLGGLGILWWMGLVLILGFNIWQYLIRNRRRW